MRLNESHHLPNDVDRCAQANCVLKTDCLRHWNHWHGREERVVMTEFPPVTKMGQGCQHQIPMPIIGENQPIS